MPKHKNPEAVEIPKRRSPKRQTTQPETTAEDLSNFPASFENKAGRYELVRLEAGQAYYSFTNSQGKTVDATMPVVTWRKMQERARLKQSA